MLKGETEQKKAEAGVAKYFANIGSGFTFCKKSAFAKVLTIMAILFWIVAAIIDYQFTSILNITFKSENAFGEILWRV